MSKERITEPLLTVEETAAILKVCVRTVRRLIADKQAPLPHVRIGSSIRIRPADLERYIAAHRHDSR